MSKMPMLKVCLTEDCSIEMTRFGYARVKFRTTETSKLCRVCHTIGVINYTKGVINYTRGAIIGKTNRRGVFLTVELASSSAG